MSDLPTKNDSETIRYIVRMLNSSVIMERVFSQVLPTHMPDILDAILEDSDSCGDYFWNWMTEGDGFEWLMGALGASGYHLHRTDARIQKIKEERRECEGRL